MTIEDLLTTLSYLPKDGIIKNIDLEESTSDRGDYYHFCLYESQNSNVRAKELSDFINNEVINHSFNGYKGGDFEMHLNTTITYGCPDCGGYNIDGLLIDEEGITIKKQKCLYY